MIRIAIVEDEDIYITELTNFLNQYQKEYEQAFEITIHRDGDAITANYKAQYDIILMDIQMRFVDGMSAAEEIRKMDSEVVIIFITNMTQYAIRGYEVNALDYVLKPVSYFAFSQKLAKAIERIKKREVKDIITVVVKGGVMRLSASDIYYIESQGHNLIYHTSSGQYIASGTINSLEKQFIDFHFSRGNKCYYINLQHVEGIQNKCAVVKGRQLQISRPRMNTFMQELTEYWGEVR